MELIALAFAVVVLAGSVALSVAYDRAETRARAHRWGHLLKHLDFPRDDDRSA